MDIHDLPPPRTDVPSQYLLRFADKIKIENGCWVWIGSCKQPPGLPYGYLSIEGLTNLAHRVSYEWFVGDINEGCEIHHECENPSCVNPDHLVETTRKEHKAVSPYDITNINSLKETCPQGHEYSQENTYVTNEGRRMCRECNRERHKVYMRERFGFSEKHDIQHGTVSMYTSKLHKCRCGPCVAAMQKYRVKYNALRRERRAIEKDGLS